MSGVDGACCLTMRLSGAKPVVFKRYTHLSNGDWAHTEGWENEKTGRRENAERVPQPQQCSPTKGFIVRVIPPLPLSPLSPFPVRVMHARLNPLLQRSSFVQGFADFPVMSERIDEASDTPAIRLISDRPNDFGARGDGAIEDEVRILDGQDHSHGTAAEGLGAEVEMLRRFIGKPELRALHGQPRDHFPFLISDAEHFFRAEGFLVELNGSGSPADGEQRGESGSSRVRFHFSRACAM
jgi:hypothetical protein